VKWHVGQAKSGRKEAQKDAYIPNQNVQACLVKHDEVQYSLITTNSLHIAVFSQRSSVNTCHVHVVYHSWFEVIMRITVTYVCITSSYTCTSIAETGQTGQLYYSWGILCDKKCNQLLKWWYTILKSYACLFEKIIILTIQPLKYILLPHYWSDYNSAANSFEDF